MLRRLALRPGSNSQFRASLLPRLGIRRSMGKKSAPKPEEICLEVPHVPSLVDVEGESLLALEFSIRINLPSVTPIYDTHTHLHSTFKEYQTNYPNGRYKTVKDFVKGFYGGPRTDDDILPAIPVPVKSIVDVWCEAPVLSKEWRELADSALTPESRAENWGDIDYHFVMG
jgi:hypothetical protein